ncbi:hypothetical protein B7P43_G17046 [Cryptotermes secundus]|uniref:Mos1 transposase HTH domain-containing protein n=1 Tax=Cryptotermes secundus TaxID=105785 RepID=A0A2J7RT50_9NEOP|nr:hypothetical protein B7P43_G17046 [Cryptotermes secundus]
MATFSLQEQRVIIRFLYLRGATPIEIHRQLSDTCGDGVMNVKNVRSWVRQFKEGRTSCQNERHDWTFFSSTVTMDETWMPFFNPARCQPYATTAP